MGRGVAPLFGSVVIALFAAGRLDNNNNIQVTQFVSGRSERTCVALTNRFSQATDEWCHITCNANEESSLSQCLSDICHCSDSVELGIYI